MFDLNPVYTDMFLASLTLPPDFNNTPLLTYSIYAEYISDSGKKND